MLTRPVLIKALKHKQIASGWRLAAVRSSVNAVSPATGYVPAHLSLISISFQLM